MTENSELESRFAELSGKAEREAHNLRLFDDMDFNAFSKQDWPYFRTTHAANVRVVMPDGSIAADVHLPS